MKTSKIYTAASAIALAATGFMAANAQEDVSNVVFIGDSLSDPGNIPATSGVPAPPPPYVGFRFSNGPVYAELLPGLLGLGAADVVNLAHGGAFTGQLQIPGAPAGLTGGNINFSLAALAQTDMLSQTNQIASGGAPLGPDTLVTVLGGANDYFLAGRVIGDQVAAGLIDPTSLAGQAAINGLVLDATSNAVSNLAASVATLNAAGAQKFMVINLPDLGGTPAGQFSGNAELFSGFTDQHNSQLASAMDGLARSTGAEVYIADLKAFQDDVQANPAKYGVINTDLPCTVDADNDGFSDTFFGGCTAETANQFAFFDTVHPTAAVHAQAANFVADTYLAPRTIAAQGETATLSAARFHRDLASITAGAGLAANETAVFGQIGVNDLERDGASGVSAYDTAVVTTTFGVARQFGEAATAGLALGLSNGEVDFTQRDAGFDYDAVRLAGFLGFSAGDVSTSLSAAYALDQYDDINRATNVAGQIARASADGSTLSGALETRWAIAANKGLTLSPLARIVATSARIDAYSEAGAVGLDQVVNTQRFTPVTGELGLAADARMGALSLMLEGGYVTELSGNSRTITTALVTERGFERRLNVDGPDSDYARFAGEARFSLGAFDLGVGGEAVSGRDDLDDWAVFGRIVTRGF